MTKIKQVIFVHGRQQMLII